MSSALRRAGRWLQRLPFSFRLATILSGDVGLRCVLFHHVSSEPCAATDALGVRIPAEEFERCLETLLRSYQPVALDDLRAPVDEWPERPLLVTFDDAYASVPRVAAPILRRLGVPAVFFVNGGLLDGRGGLALDNLLCLVTTEFGFEPVHVAMAEAGLGLAADGLASVHDVIHGVVPRLTPARRVRFEEAVRDASGVDGAAYAREHAIYASEDDIRGLPSLGVEIGNHTTSHVFCRTLEEETLASEIVENARRLAILSGAPVRAFGVPYGSSQDLTPALQASLRDSGHEWVFLVEGCANPRRNDLVRCDRSSLHSGDPGEVFGELEILARLRRVRRRIHHLF